MLVKENPLPFYAQVDANVASGVVSLLNFREQPVATQIIAKGNTPTMIVAAQTIVEGTISTMITFESAESFSEVCHKARYLESLFAYPQGVATLGTIVAKANYGQHFPSFAARPETADPSRFHFSKALTGPWERPYAESDYFFADVETLDFESPARCRFDIKPSMYGLRTEQRWQRFFPFQIMRTEPLYAQIRRVLAQIQIPHHLDKEVLHLVDTPMLQAMNIVSRVLAKRISAGLRARDIEIEPLTDRVAGRWSEVVFVVRVDLSSEDANREWDSVLTEILEVANAQSDLQTANCLSENIGIHFEWV